MIESSTCSFVMTLSENSSIPLCVDLDGTLVRSDMLFESTLMLVRQHPACMLKFPFWLARGKANLKAQIAARVNLSSASIPYNEEILAFVREQRATRKTVLVTGSHQSIADIVADQTQAFDQIQGSSEQVNLTNSNKRDWLVQEFGENGFDYIGNDSDDLVVWPASRQALAVSTPQGIARTSGQDFERVFETDDFGIKDLLSLIRVHQWSKNALVLVPFALDQRIGDWPATFAIVLAFFAMSFLASMTYILNDMLDLQADRLNETKKHRAMASGKVPLLVGIKAMIALGIAVCVCAFFLPAQFNLILVAYLLSTLWYSFYLKRVMMLDVCMIAALHTLRIIAGTLAIAAAWSFWLLAFSMFIFFSLAMAKRVSELMNLQAAGVEKTVGRDYLVADLPVLTACGVATGFISVLVVALYINSEKVSEMYSTPQFLWLVCPILMYWIGRLWMKTGRGEMHEDPIIFAMRDKVSLETVVLMMIVVGAAAFV